MATTTAAPAAPLAVYRVTLLSFLAKNTPLLALTGILGGVGVMMLWRAAAQPGGSPVPLDGMIPAAVLALGAVVWAALPRVFWVEVYADGVAWQDLTGRHRVTWDQVRSVQRSIRLVVNGWTRRADLTLTPADGGTAVFDFGLAGYDEMADLIQQLQGRRNLAARAAALERGPVAFGPVTLTPDGLSVRGHLLPWAGFDYAVDSGCLVVVPPGGPARMEDRLELRLGEIPDAPVLLELMARVGKPPIDALRTVPAAVREQLL
jgi:hypothetical protein